MIAKALGIANMDVRNNPPLAFASDRPTPPGQPLKCALHIMSVAYIPAPDRSILLARVKKNSAKNKPHEAHFVSFDRIVTTLQVVSGSQAVFSESGSESLDIVCCIVLL